MVVPILLCPSIPWISEIVQSYPNAKLLDWKGTMDLHPECFYSDMTHLRPEGAEQYAGFILTNLAGSLPPPALPPPNTVVQLLLPTNKAP